MYVPNGWLRREPTFVRRSYDERRQRCQDAVQTKKPTLSKLILMLPTLVAPTGTMPKKPNFQRPSKATRSFRTNKFSNRFAIQGETEKRSPAQSVLRISCH